MPRECAIEQQERRPTLVEQPFDREERLDRRDRDDCRRGEQARGEPPRPVGQPEPLFRAAHEVGQRMCGALHLLDGVLDRGRDGWERWQWRIRAGPQRRASEHGQRVAERSRLGCEGEEGLQQVGAEAGEHLGVGGDGGGHS
jgi:hypothetical protein